MAGSVGGAVAGAPGYAGYVPSCQQPLTSTNSSVTSRMPLVDRKLKSQLIGSSGGKVSDEADILRDPTAMYLPKRTTEKSIYSTQGEYRPDSSTWSQPKTKAALLLSSQSLNKTDVTAVPFTATSVYKGVNSIEKQPDTGFYSRVRKEEHRDAEESSNKVTKSTRSSAKEQVPTEKKLKKRMDSESMVPPKQVFEGTERRTLLGAEPVNATEFVKFLGSHESLSSSKREYGVRGYDPARNLPTTIDSLSKQATTADLLAGTAKSALGLRLPGYMGHVPAGKATMSTITSDKKDLLKQNAQNLRLLCTSKRTLPGYSGYEPKSLVNDTGRPNRPDINQTSSGESSMSVTKGAEEKAMNSLDHAKQAGIRKFFTQGDGQPDHSISEQYFVKYRPMEGYLKMGSPLDRIIPRAR
eukprot:TRINITY_DN18380_c0_g1_i1.p1 TRINITY_DN18380_c0_g1~~TRINITY_DN18380_c0_g1_i1.p1  ORF type:complete len:411 (+),score=75.03 TRINITY_DN18380_c0_g1_i1:87-1319(+)